MHFYREESYQGVHVPWKRWTLRAMLGKSYWHCLLDYKHFLWTCSPTIGCRSLHTYPAVPAATFEISSRELDLRPWITRRKFEYWRSIADVLGFLPEKARAMNCVRATAVALGLTQHLRTPQDLFDYLLAWSESWLIHSPQR